MKDTQIKAPGLLSTLAYSVCMLLLRCLFSPVSRTRVLHPERASLRGPCILAPNHISHFDPPVLSLAAPRQIDWMAMAELFQNRAFGFLLHLLGTFPVARGRPDRASLRTAVNRLRAGRVVGIFPEGGIRDSEASILRSGKPRAGLSVVASMAGAPVIPVVIFGTDRLYNSRRWRRFRGTELWVGFGEPILPPPGSSEERARWEEAYVLALRSLAIEVAAHFGLDEDDWPLPPGVRMKEY